MIKWPDLWPLMESGDYRRVVEALRLESVHWSKTDWRRPITLGMAHLALREFLEAATSFLRSHELAVEESDRNTGTLLREVGAALWLSGNRQEGAGYWLDFVISIRKRKIQFADISGGIDVGLLLLYAGASLKDQQLSDKAIEFLRYVSKRPRAAFMPGPLAKYVLDEISIDSILADEFGSAQLETCLFNARSNVLWCRHLSQILLCMSTVERLAGNEIKAASYCCMAASLENPLVQAEWYLSEAECLSFQLAKSGKSS